MSKTDYTALDAAIVAEIAAGKHPYGGAASAEARKLEGASALKAWGGKSAYRFIDNRLQHLRKAGEIIHSKKAWRITAPEGKQP